MFGFEVLVRLPISPTPILLPAKNVSLPQIITGVSLAKTYQEFISNLAIDMKCYKKHTIKKAWRIK